MVTLNLTLTEEDFTRLAAAARREGVKVEDLVRDAAVHAAADLEARQRFETLARRGDRAAGIAVLDAVDAAFGTDSQEPVRRP